MSTEDHGGLAREPSSPLCCTLPTRPTSLTRNNGVETRCEIFGKPYTVNTNGAVRGIGNQELTIGSGTDKRNPSASARDRSLLSDARQAKPRNIALVGCGAVARALYLPVLAKHRAEFGHVWLVDPSDHARSIAASIVSGSQAGNSST